MITTGWGYFENTGEIEAYLLYCEYKRLLCGEYAEDIIEKQEDDYELEGEGPDNKRD